MCENMRFDNSIGVSSSTMEKSLPDGKKLQEQVFYAVTRHMQERDILICVDLSHPSFDGFLRPSGICAALDRICRQEEPSLFSEYSVNLDELSDSSATSPCES